MNRANRLKQCRSMLKKTLKELGDTHKISIGSLSNWESGASPISEKNVHKIISLLAAEGLICTKEWLLEERGDAPYLLTPSPSFDERKDEPFDITNQFLIYKEIESFKKAHPEMLLTLMRDETMSPFLRIGDYVGGPIISPEVYLKEHGNICIVETEKNQFLVRQLFLQKSYILLLSMNQSTENHLLLLEHEPLSVAPVTFMRRFRE